MNMSQKPFEPYHDTPPNLLIDQQESLLAMPMEKKSYEALKSYLPLNSVDDTQCTLRNPQRLVRIMVLFPLLIAVLLIFHHNVVDFLVQKKDDDVNILRWVKIIREEYGEDFYLRKDLPNKIESARFIGNDKTVSFWKYLYYRYNYFHASTKILIQDFFLFGTLLAFSLVLIYTCFFWRLQAPIFIDRNRQLFFSWYKGKVYAARYSQVGISYQAGPGKITQVMGLAMYTLNNDNSLIYKPFQLCLAYLSFWGFNSKLQQDEAHAFIIKYLIKGKDAVAATDYKRFPALFLFKDKKPVNFDEQMERILMELDKRDNEKTSNTNERENK
ncbi:hypothetical protein [Xenorhabdus innexi]|uniref:Transmembrane protein n=1 Tax=Xenorhabdus innexi TaxID=290109 RepID=A0A1N6MSQ0_9GAMM|nr:hypothetical protein [Xenorhabdus innexi]PHM37307.1 hypothetical protein Xinn_00980 [Xenorhabdus innexi]SIP71872.1 conserved hypothetical protein [Xenorhabdus innexi]